LADSLAEKGRLDDAIGEYKKSVALKADASTYNNLGTALQKKGEVHSALWYYMYAIGLKQNFHQAYTNLGGAFLEVGQVEEAKKVCDVAVELASFSGKAHECRGLVLVRQGSLDQAVEELKIVVSLQPENPNFVRNLDVAYRLKLDLSK
jgi:Flp pilus assembly protein TadD